jgi:hypothetical protein
MRANFGKSDTQEKIVPTDRAQARIAARSIETKFARLFPDQVRGIHGGGHGARERAPR